MEGLFSKKLKIYIEGFVDSISSVIGNKISDEKTITEIQRIGSKRKSSICGRMLNC